MGSGKVKDGPARVDDEARAATTKVDERTCGARARNGGDAAKRRLALWRSINLPFKRYVFQRRVGPWSG